MVEHLVGHHGRKRLRLLGLVAILAVTASTCGDDDGGASASTTTGSRPLSTTTSSTTSTTTSDPAEREIAAAYEAASRAFIDAAAIPDPDFARLAETHTGPMLDQSRNLLRALKADGRLIRYPQNSQYRIEVDDIEVEGDVARLVACVVDDGERVEAATGRVIASGVGTVEWTAALRRVDGAWRLAERREEERWDGVAGCAVH